jgi:hypothetical protein
MSAKGRTAMEGVVDPSTAKAEAGPGVGLVAASAAGLAEAGSRRAAPGQTK